MSRPSPSPARTCGQPLPLSPASVARNQGVSLIFSLITLGVLSLAAVALIRSVDTGALILGNLGFKQDTRLAADEATRLALTWIGPRLNGTTLHATDTASAYWAANVPDPTNAEGSNNARAVVDWTGGTTCSAYTAGSFDGGCLPSADAKSLAGSNLPGSVAARYVILRLCESAGDPKTVSCARPIRASTSDSGEKDEVRIGQGQRLVTSAVSEYYRVIVRTQGPRNTVTFTETLVHF
jgi:hypothetical protein